MTTNMEAFQALLEGMRADFLAELPERCDSFDESILALENRQTIAKPSMSCTAAFIA